MDQRVGQFSSAFFEQFRHEFPQPNPSFPAPQVVPVPQSLGQGRQDPSPSDPPGSLTGFDGERVEPLLLGRPTPTLNDQVAARCLKALEDLKASGVLSPAAFEEAVAKLNEQVLGPVPPSPTLPDIPSGQPTPAAPVLLAPQVPLPGVPGLGGSGAGG